VGGRRAGVGFLSAMMEWTGAPLSNSKSPDSIPNGRRAGRSRLVHVSRTVRLSTSGATGRCSRSTSERNISVPSSSGGPKPAAKPSKRPAAATRVAVAKGIERLEANRFLRVRPHTDHFVHGKNFGGVGTADVGDDGVIEAPLVSRMGSAVCSNRFTAGAQAV